MMLSVDLQKLVNKNKALFRDCKIDKLNEEAVVERFLNYAEIDDIKQMISLIGYNKVRDIFKQQITKERINYTTLSVSLFSLYFKLRNELSSSLKNIIQRTKRNTLSH